MKTAVTALLFGVWLIWSPAHATVVTFFGEDLSPTSGKPAGNIPNSLAARDAFLATLGKAFLFDAESGLGSTPTLESFTGTAGTVGTRNTRFGGDVPASQFLGVDFSISGTEILGGTEGWSLFDFSAPTNAFGLFGILVPTDRDPGGTITRTPIRLSIEFTNGDSEDFNAPDTLGLDTPGIAFFGLTDDSRFFERIVVHGTITPNLDLLFDDVHIGSRSVPAPATMALMLPGLLTLLAWRRRNARQRRHAPVS